MYEQEKAQSQAPLRTVAKANSSCEEENTQREIEGDGGLKLPINEIVCGDCLEVMKDWPSDSIDCCVTSPPYWGLRDYGIEGQLGLEKTPEEFVAKMVAIFAEVKRVLKPEGTLWLNMGDSYVSGKGRYSSVPQTVSGKHRGEPIDNNRPDLRGHDYLKDKDLAGTPWRVAFALQRNGWYLRQDIIWHKPNPMPESVRDRCTKAHEYIFLLTKNPRYYYDADAIREGEQVFTRKAGGYKKHKEQMIDGYSPFKGKGGFADCDITTVGRNKRSVWTVPNNDYYVFSDGKLYRVSLDCPIHSPYHGQQKSQTELHGEQQDSHQNHNLDKPTHHGREQISESSAIPSLFSPEAPTMPDSGREQISENTSENKTGDSFRKAEPENHPCTLDNTKTPVCNSDYSSPSDEPIATDRNKQKSKNASSTSSSCKALSNKSDHTVHKSNQSLPHYTKAHCTCQEINVRIEQNKPDVWNVTTKAYSEAHFATFPPKLIEPCILAGCPEWVCKSCGKARVRIIETEQIKRRRKTPVTKPCNERSPSANAVAGVTSKTTGWIDCGCGTGFEGGIVLDPFMGSGTTAMVAYENRRNYVGIELNPEYIKLNRAYIAKQLKKRYWIVSPRRLAGLMAKKHGRPIPLKLL